MKKLFAASLVALFAIFAQAATENFDALTVGQPPAGWTVGITGAGTPVWTVVTDDSAPSKPRVLKQSGQVPKPSYPQCIQSQPAFKDGFVEVKFKAISGEVDQAAGVIWRCQDTNNYYICRANALEDNLVLYKVEAGKRTALPIVGRKEGYGMDTKVAPKEWHTLRVDFSGNMFTVSFNGQKLFAVEDSTFTKPGKVGLWTKADSVTLFDDFKSGALKN